MRDRNPMRLIDTREQLVALSAELGMGDWHEPDERGVTAHFRGEIFDNAGFWPTGNGSGSWYDGDERTEMYIVLRKDGNSVAAINLATLMSWASNWDMT